MNNILKIESVINKMKDEKKVKVKRRLLKSIKAKEHKKDFDYIIGVWLEDLFYSKRLESIKYYFRRNNYIQDVLYIRMQLVMLGYDDKKIGNIIKEFNRQSSNVFFHNHNLVMKFILEDLLNYAKNFKSNKKPINTADYKHKTKKDSFFDRL